MTYNPVTSQTINTIFVVSESYTNSPHLPVQNFRQIQDAIDYNAYYNISDFAIDVKSGDFLNPIYIPETNKIIIHGIHNELTKLGDVYWTVGAGKKIIFENCFIQNVYVNDGSTFTTDAALVFRNCHINNISVLGTIKPRIALIGPVLASGLAVTAIPLSKVDGYVQAAGCKLTIGNIAVYGTIHCNDIICNGGRLDGYLYCDGYTCGLDNTNFSSNPQIIFTGPAGIVNIGPIANYKFHQANGTIVNGSLNIMDNLLQTNSNEIAVNTTTTSTSFVDLISTTITTKTGSKLLLNFTTSASCSSANTTMFFRLMVDGVAKRGGGTRYIGAPSGSVAISQAITGLAAGSHTIKVQWKVGAATGQIRPVAAPDSESACLTIMETLV